jgi:hypothetical protein
MILDARCEALTSHILLDTGKYSDFIITCNGDTYKVHKAVVCAMSGFFERAERFSVGKVCFQGRKNATVMWHGNHTNDRAIGVRRRQGRSSGR